MNYDIKIVPYAANSKAAKALALELDCKRLRVSGSLFNPIGGELIINMGNKNSYHPAFTADNVVVLNRPEKIINKKELYNENNQDTFKSAGIFLPESTTKYTVAREWKGKVYGRKLLNSHSGRGILIWDDGSDIDEDCPLYTKCVPSDREYRVHFFRIDGHIELFVQQKKRKKDFVNHNEEIRNFTGGWIYAIKDLDVPECVNQQGIAIGKFLKQEFGAIDILYCEKEDKATVLEVNSCPGLFSPTLKAWYVKNIKDFYYGKTE